MNVSQIERNIRSSADAILALADQAEKIGMIGNLIIESLKSGGKVLTAGNGGSAAESLHMAEELVGRFRSDRCPLAAVSLAADCTALTCIANDFGYDSVFSRQVEGLGRAGDVLVLFSTSGGAVNLKRALEAAQQASLHTVSILGRDGGPLAGLSDYELIVPGNCTERIQEVHQVALHLILDCVEEAFS